MIDEQAGERGGLRQVAAAVVAQIEHQPVDVLGLQLAAAACATSRVVLR